MLPAITLALHDLGRALHQAERRAHVERVEMVELLDRRVRMVARPTPCRR